MVNVAILGYGTVGNGTAQVLTGNLENLEKRLGQKINIKYILDLREFPDDPLGGRVIHDFKIIENDPEVSIVAEMLGGAHPAYDFSAAALRAGKSVVTSNKEVVEKFGDELLRLAEENRVRYRFEASVGGRNSGNFSTHALCRNFKQGNRNQRNSQRNDKLYPLPYEQREYRL